MPAARNGTPGSPAFRRFDRLCERVRRFVDVSDQSRLKEGMGFITLTGLADFSSDWNAPAGPAFE
jgi:hypothetical protein